MEEKEIGKAQVKLTYDDRRKILNQKKSIINENKKEAVLDGEGNIIEKEILYSTVESNMNANYTEEGIRLAYKNSSEERSFLEKRIADMKKQQDELEEMPENLKELKSNLEALQKYQKADQLKLEYKAIQERFKEVKKEIAEMKDAVGTRLKL